MVGIVVAIVLAAIGGFLLRSAIGFRRSGQREQFLITLAGSLPFVVASGWVLWNGLPTPRPDVPVDHAIGFPPGWHCTSGTRHKFCIRAP
jgi:hypothetical protein